MQLFLLWLIPLITYYLTSRQSLQVQIPNLLLRIPKYYIEFFYLAATTALVLQSLYCLDAGLQHYIDLTSDLISVDKVHDMGVIGIDLNSLIEEANSIFGGLIVIEYGSNLISSTLNLFSSLSIFNINYGVRLHNNYFQSQVI